MTKHTTTPISEKPWRYEVLPHGVFISSKRFCVAKACDENHAAFIVKAVNCHDDLVNELQDLYDFVIDRDYADEESDGMKAAAAILAKAKGAA